MKSTLLKKTKSKSMYMTFPIELTDEEKMLQSKFQKLRKKKKAMEKQKAPPQPDPKPNTPTSTKKRSISPKIEAREARERARKLIRTGKLVIPQIHTQTNEGFKRSLGLERRSTAAVAERPVSYQPFSAATSQEGEDKFGPSGTARSMDDLNKSFQAVCNLTKADIVAGARKSFDDDTKRAPANRGGNTIYVNCEQLSEESLRTIFSPFGKIINITVDDPKHHGFVTFQKQDFATKAVEEVNGKRIDGIYYKVSIARRHQSNFGLTKRIAVDSISAPPKIPPHHGREPVAYDEDLSY